MDFGAGLGPVDWKISYLNQQLSTDLSVVWPVAEFTAPESELLTSTYTVVLHSI